MSCYMDWEFKTKKPLTSHQIEALVALDEFDLCCDGWDMDSMYFGEISTESCGALMRIEEALHKWAELYPEEHIIVSYRYDTSWNPDGYEVKNGKVYPITGHVVYTYDNTGEKMEEFQ